MEGPHAGKSPDHIDTPTSARPARPAPGGAAGGSRWRDFGSLALLVLVLAGLRTWLAWHTEVAARDSIGFIHIAWEMQRCRSWSDCCEVVRSAEQHPGYPLVILAASWPVHQLTAGREEDVMQRAAQVASIIAGLLLVVPTYYLGKELFDRRVAFWAVLLFQLLPACNRVLGDGLSEATFLLCAVTALYLAVRALRTTAAPLWFGLAGLCGGCAYLVRPEGAVVVAAIGAALLAVQAVRGWRRPWRSWLACAASLVLAAVVVGGPFVLITGKLTTKPAGEYLDGAAERADLQTPPSAAGMASVAPDQPLLASVLGVWRMAGKTHLPKVWWGLWALGYELYKGFYYVLWVPALLGLWWFRGRFRSHPGTWALLALCLTMGLLLWWLAVRAGYISDRHTLLLLLCGCFWAVAALQVIAAWLGRTLWRQGTLAAAGERGPRWCAPLLLLVLAAAMLPKTLEPLHYNRSGFRAVGYWLADHTQPTDFVLDPYSWADYYAGRVLLTGHVHPTPPDHTATWYVVWEESVNAHPRLEGWWYLAHKYSKMGELVHRWHGVHGKDNTEIAVYRLDVVITPEERERIHQLAAWRGRRQ
jgi:hypothetical protein